MGPFMGHHHTSIRNLHGECGNEGSVSQAPIDLPDWTGVWGFAPVLCTVCCSQRRHGTTSRTPSLWRRPIMADLAIQSSWMTLLVKPWWRLGILHFKQPTQNGNSWYLILFDSECIQKCGIDSNWFMRILSDSCQEMGYPPIWDLGVPYWQSHMIYVGCGKKTNISELLSFWMKISILGGFVKQQNITGGSTETTF